MVHSNAETMQTTLKKVAERAGVSYQTVWRALHGEGRVSPETQERILRIAKELNYRTNRFATALRTNRSGTIGLVVLDVSNAFTGSVTRAIEKEARARGYTVSLANSDGMIEREREAVMGMLEHRVEGIIISGAEGDNGYLANELPKGFPLVWINKPLPGLGLGGVGARNRDAGAAAADYLVARGHKDLGGVFGPFANTPFQSRHDGFVEGLARHGLRHRKEWLAIGDNTIEFARAAFHRMMRRKSRPTGAFTTSYRLTEGVLLAIQDLGLERNRDIEIVGYDIQYAELLQPPVAVFRQPYEALARCAVERLTAGIEGKPLAELGDLPVPLCGPPP